MRPFAWSVTSTVFSGVTTMSPGPRNSPFPEPSLPHFRTNCGTEGAVGPGTIGEAQPATRHAASTASHQVSRSGLIAVNPALDGQLTCAFILPQECGPFGEPNPHEKLGPDRIFES